MFNDFAEKLQLTLYIGFWIAIGICSINIFFSVVPFKAFLIGVGIFAVLYLIAHFAYKNGWRLRG